MRLAKRCSNDFFCASDYGIRFIRRGRGAAAYWHVRLSGNRKRRPRKRRPQFRTLQEAQEWAVQYWEGEWTRVAQWGWWKTLPLEMRQHLILSGDLFSLLVAMDYAEEHGQTVDRSWCVQWAKQTFLHRERKRLASA